MILLVDAVRDGMEITTSPQFQVSPVGLQVSGELSFDEWRDIGSRFAQGLRSFAFCVGDWLIYGESKWGRQLPLGEKIGLDSPRQQIARETYEDAIALTGLHMSTLQTYASVCRCIPIAERDPRLSFEHHKALAPVPSPVRPQWLALASSQDSPISVKKLRASIRLAGETPRIVSAEEIMERVDPGVAHDNYVPHLTRLLTVLRRTLPTMDDGQRQALKDDMKDLVVLLSKV